MGKALVLKTDDLSLILLSKYKARGDVQLQSQHFCRKRINSSQGTRLNAEARATSVLQQSEGETGFQSYLTSTCVP